MPVQIRKEEICCSLIIKELLGFFLLNSFFCHAFDIEGIWTDIVGLLVFRKKLPGRNKFHIFRGEAFRNASKTAFGEFHKPVIDMVAESHPFMQL